MSTYKLVNITQLEYDLSRIAQAMRDKFEFLGDYKLTFPDGMITAIQDCNIYTYTDFSNASIELAPGAPVFQTVDIDDLESKLRSLSRAIGGKVDYNLTLQFPIGFIGLINAMGDGVASYSFTFGGSRYTYNEGETWADWINREGTNYSFTTDKNGYVMFAIEQWYVQLNDQYVLSSDLIQATSYYYTSDAPTANMITFYINNDEEAYTCSPGMTWRQYNLVINGNYSYEGAGGTLCLGGESTGMALVYGERMVEQYYYDYVGIDDVIQRGYYRTTSTLPQTLGAGFYTFKYYDQLAGAPVSPFRYECANQFYLYENDTEGNVVDASMFSSNYIEMPVKGYVSVQSAVPVYGQIYYRDLPNILFGGQYYPAGDLVGQNSYITCRIQFPYDTVVPSNLATWMLDNTTYSST